MERTLDTTNMEQAELAGVKFSGDPGAWVCICKAWNKSEGWMKSTKVLEVPGAGVFLQVTTKERGGLAEAVTFAPAIRLNDERTGLVSDFSGEDDEDELDGFLFDVTSVADTITFHAVFRGSVIDKVSVSRIELRQDDDHLLGILDPFLVSVLEILDMDYGVDAEMGQLVRSLLTSVDSVRR